MTRIVSPKLLEHVEEATGRRRLTYWCQGCQESHSVYVENGPPNANWGWNGDVDRPVFSPSVLYQSTKHIPPVTPENLAQWREKPWEQQRVDWRCHTFIGCNGAQPGQVIFLDDCTHDLRGVHELPDLPERALRLCD